MDRFSQLFIELDSTTKTSRKLAALRDYFTAVDEQDALWALWLLSGNTHRRAVTTTQLKDWSSEIARIPRWLFDEGYIRVGDLAETVSMLVLQTASSQADQPLHVWMETIGELRSKPEDERKAYIVTAWQSLDQIQKFIFTKLITGSFRVGASRALAVRALAETRNIDSPSLLHVLTGNWNPAETTLHKLMENQGTSIHPYPFFLASPIGEREALGQVDEWQFEWKWDGIRGQIVRRGSETALWSRGEDIVSDQFPELLAMAAELSDGTVLDGEIIAWKDEVLPFAVLQTRLGRKSITVKLQTDAPVAYMAYDVLEWQGKDIRDIPLVERRSLLDTLVSKHQSPLLQTSPVLTGKDWSELEQLQRQGREHKAEGLMVKRLQSSYQTGRVRGDWWKWKVDPLSVDAVMINAQRGHGRRSAVYSDYTFAVRGPDGLVPFAKAYSGLTDAEINKVDAFVKRHTLEKFGPVRSVSPELVFEIGFEGIAPSKRHKSGVAVRFPRILRTRPDKPVEEIDTVETLQQLLKDLS
jgi:DNA ligase-1